MLLTIITSKTAIKLNKKLTSEKRHFSNGKMYFGIYTFLMSAAEPIIELKEAVVASEKNAQIEAPTI